MDVVLAEKYGFCAGVRVADKLVRLAAKRGEKGAILGQVVHNESVESEMAGLGFPTVHALEDARDHEGRIVFSASRLSRITLVRPTSIQTRSSSPPPCCRYSTGYRAVVLVS